MNKDDCLQARNVTYATVEVKPSGSPPSMDEMETAFRHLMNCQSCRIDLDAEHRGRFVSRFVLLRD
jgi:hypothetical protein